MKIFILGTGNVAASLGKALLKAGHKITGVYGRNAAKSDKLASILECKSFSDLTKLPVTSDFYLIAISDRSIAKVASQLQSVNGILIHTSGSTSLSALKRKNRVGVLYPVETITGSLPRSFSEVPLCIEASDEISRKKILLLASSLSENIYLLNTEQRASLHIAAVFANNFTNHMLVIATSILEQNNLPPELINQLAISTAKNAFKLGPEKAQTGPAIRNDMPTIERHLSYLKKNKGFAELYKLITNQIIAVHKKVNDRLT